MPTLAVTMLRPAPSPRVTRVARAATPAASFGALATALGAPATRIPPLLGRRTFVALDERTP